MARILILSPFEPPDDGIAKHTARLVAAWDDAGHTVLVIAPRSAHSGGRIESVGSRSTVVRIQGQTPRRSVWNEASDFAPDIVFVQFAISAVSVNLWAVRSLARKFFTTGTPVVVSYHEPAREYDLLKFLSRAIYRAMARITEVPIVFSAAGRQALTVSGLFDEVIELPHGTVGIAEISDDDVERVKNLYDIRKPLVLSLGFTSSDKGTDVLLDAAAAIGKAQAEDVQFLIAGSPRKRRGVFRLMGRRDVRFQQRLEKRATEIPDVKISFCGFVRDTDVAALLFTADVVALPYRRITQSGIANLALSSRAVVVGSDLPGLRSSLGDAATYVDVDDSSSLSDEIIKLLGDDNEPTRQRMRELSGERATADTYAKVAEQILSAGVARRSSRGHKQEIKSRRSDTP